MSIESQKRLRAFRREHGLCKDCGCEPVVDGYVRCNTCLLIRRLKKREYAERIRNEKEVRG